MNAGFQSALTRIEVALPGRCQRDASLAELSHWRIGGPAALLVVPESAEELSRLLSVCATHDLPWWIVGRGSNLLFADEGLAGVVIRLGSGFERMEFDSPFVTVGAALRARPLSLAAAERGLSGLEFAAGIPATVGGMLRMNAGAHGGEISGLVRHVNVVEQDGTLRTLSAEEMGFAYRKCEALQKRIAVEAVLELGIGDTASIQECTREMLRHRRETQPLDYPSCGSVFKRPATGAPGQLIEAAGLKGRKIGGIRVSQMHANFFVNEGGGKARDVLALVELVKQAVLEHSGVTLEEEFHYVH